MTRLLLAAALVALSLPAVTAQPKAKAPKLIQEDSRKILVFTYGAGEELVVGDVRWKPDALYVSTKFSRFGVGYLVKNLSPTTPAKKADVIKPQDATARDDVGKSYQGVDWTLPPGTTIEPGEEVRVGYTSGPLPGPNVKHVVAEFPAAGGDADLWRIVYPRATWIDPTKIKKQKGK